MHWKREECMQRGKSSVRTGRNQTKTKQRFLPNPNSLEFFLLKTHFSLIFTYYLCSFSFFKLRYFPQYSVTCTEAAFLLFPWICSFLGADNKAHRAHMLI